MHELHRHWKSLLLRGIAAVIFGLVAFSLPTLTLSVLVYLFGIFFLVDGIIIFLVGVSSGTSEFMIEGVVGVLLGILLFLFPSFAVTSFFFLVALWAIVTGVIEILAAVKLREIIRHEFWLILAGVVSVLFGMFVFFNPLATAVVLTMFLGVYAVFFGSFITGLALRVRSLPSPSSKAKKKK